MKSQALNRHRAYQISDSGQTSFFVLLAVGIFLLAIIALAVDVGNFWFHRQAAQGAADAACTAGAMDMLVNATAGKSLGNFTTGTNFDCSGSTSAVPCQYAKLNGYDGTSSSPGNDVQISFVPTSSIAGIDSKKIPSIAPDSMRVDIIDHVQSFFSGLLTGKGTQDVHVRATCAVLNGLAPVPLIILKPDCAGTFQLQGSGNVAIVGGPTRSIQVNSDNPAGTLLAGSGSVNLSNGGPKFTGSHFAVFGGPSTPPKGFSGGTTGGWTFPATPMADPYANLLPPPMPPAAATPASVPPGWNGCPDNMGCTEYFPGLYTTPIVVKGGTAIFDPGLYYFNIPAGAFAKGNCGTPGGCIAKPSGACNYALLVSSGGVIRPGTNLTCSQCDTSGGTTFYLSGSGGSGGFGSVLFDANAGKPASGHTVANYSTSTLSCPGAPPPDTFLSLPGSVPGNVLLGPCTQDGTYFTSSTNNSTSGPVRGMLFFQDRANGNNDGQPSMQGGGGLLIGGAMYFHNCPNSLTTGCNPATDYNAFLQFQGNSGSSTYLLGEIITDELTTGGGGSLAMQLNSNNVFTILKVALVQ